MCTRCSFLGGLAGLALLPASASARTGDPQELEIAFPAMRRISDVVWLGQLSAHVWVHTTTHQLDDKTYYPANGLIVTSARESLLVDTGWNDRHANAIVTAWERTGRPPITQALVTHFHADRLGGVRALAKRKIPAFGNPLTIGLAIDNGLPPPRPLHDLEKRPQRLQGVEVYYPGAGHTMDNIVAWVPEDGVLFGGCLVKATTAPDLGYLADADPAAWPATIRNVSQRYRRFAPRHVVPGHGTVAGDALAHTTALADALARSPRAG